jgi:outer membrane protein assembly factor BamB
MKHRDLNRILTCVSLAACLGALALAFHARMAMPAAAGPGRTSALSVLWRLQMAAKPSLPCAVANGWVVADAAGGVTALSPEGKRVWQVAFSNEEFECAAAAVGELAVVASLRGRVIGLSAATGETVWARETEARFQQAPLTGERGGEAVVWLVSQEDGQLFCLRAADGSVVWKSEPTNRCDGEPVAWENRIAYGNCDGAIHVFDAESGARVGTVEVGSDDQMAGGVLATKDGRLAAGTRQGNLAVVNAKTLTREAVVAISQSEAFVKPVEAFGGLIAMGTQEGEVVFWRAGDKPFGRVTTGAAVSGLLFEEGRLYVLSGGSLCVFDAQDRLTGRLLLGDDVRGPVAGRRGLLVCVADQAVVCLKGGG